MHPVFYLFLLWTLYYIVLHIFNKKCGAEWNSRIVAFSHAFILCRITEWTLFSKYPLNGDKFGMENCIEVSNILIFSLSYFMFETCWCCYMQTEDLVMMVHHFVSLISIFGSYYIKNAGYELCYMLWAAEFTNPFLQIRWFLRSLELHVTICAKINELLFVILFIAFRLFFASYLVYLLFLVRHRVNSFLLVFAMLFHCVNIIFVFQVIQLVKRRVLSPRTSKIKKWKFTFTHFMSLVPLCIPWKHQKTRSFFYVCRGYRKRPVSWIGEISSSCSTEFLRRELKTLSNI